MTTSDAFVPLLLNLTLIAALPKIFFRRDGTFNAMWFVTALPFFLAGAVVLFCATGVWSAAFEPPESAARLAAWAGAALATASVALIAYTIGTHRKPLALWHQRNDAPEGVVTHGAYSRVRHPFYAAFLLTLVGVVLTYPHAVSAAALVYGVVVLNLTAAREERRLLRSEFAEKYRAYHRRTPRFFPRLGRSLP